MTIAMMARFGVTVERQAYERFRVVAGQQYRPLNYTIELSRYSVSYRL